MINGKQKKICKSRLVIQVVPAPKGNKNAVKGTSTKNKRYLLKITAENLKTLKKIAKQEKTLMAQVIEKALLAAYPKLFSEKFSFCLGFSIDNDS